MKASGRDKNGKYQKGRVMPQEERDKISQAMIGNANRLKIKSEELQKVAFAIYCDWLAMGRDKKGFVCDYVDENGKEGSVTYQTIENYVKSQRFDLDPSQQERAECLGFARWETTGIQMMTGEMKNCQPAIYQMMMRNKYSWDKEAKSSHVHETDAKKFMQYCDGMPEQSGHC
jgi:hypothetical protein